MIDAPERLFGALLREYRSAAGISQEELAERARLSAKTIGALERGERQSPYRDTVELLANALSLNAGERRELLEAARRRRVRPPHGGNQVSTPHPLVADAQRHNLPLETTRLVGRDRACAAVLDISSAARLVTLVGIGGVGKTRLATAVARRRVGDFADGVRLVELAPLAAETEIAAAVASAAGTPALPGCGPREALIAGLRDRELLLVLDNCEHVLGAVADVARAILEHCANVAIVATSREPLRVRGERVWRVPPLPVPADDSPAAVAASESAALFCERAAAAWAGFAVRTADTAALAAICRRLDGIPLALELAAARVETLSLAVLARALDDRFAVLTGGERTAAARHQALRTTIAWSCDLLSARDNAAFRRAGIFVDGFTLDALVEVCADGVLSETDILEALASLVDKSLVIAEAGPDRVRYRMFESTLAFARERLAAAGEREMLALRHAAYMCAFVHEHGWEMWESPAPGLVEDVAADVENVHAALRFCIDEGNDPQRGARLVVDSAPLLRRLDRRQELELRLEALLMLPAGDLDPAVEAAANYELLYSMYAEPERQRTAGERAVALLRATGSAARCAHATALLAQTLAVCFGRYDEAYPLIDEALRFARAGTDRALLDQVLRLASQALPPEALAERRRASAESVALAQASGIDRRIADALITAAEVEFAAGAYDRALSLGAEALTAQRAIANRTGLALQLTNVAAYALAAGDFSMADACAREALPVAAQIDSRLALLLAIQHLAGVSLARDRDARRAAHLLGFVDAQFAAAGFVRETTERVSYERDRAAIESVLGEAAAGDAFALGALFTDERARNAATGS